MYCIIPFSANECNLREVYTMAPREERQMANDDVRSEKMTYGRNPDRGSNRPFVMRLQLILYILVVYDMRTICKYSDAICSCVYLIYIARKSIMIQV
jgi:hypothetical protein